MSVSTVRIPKPCVRKVSIGLVEIRENLSDDNSELEPPDPMPNSEVKRFSADGSLGFPHVRVGHRQALIIGPPRLLYGLGGFF